MQLLTWINPNILNITLNCCMMYTVYIYKYIDYKILNAIKLVIVSVCMLTISLNNESYHLRMRYEDVMRVKPSILN